MRLTKRSVYAGLAGVGVLLGAGGLAAAATGTDATPAPAVVQQADPVTDPTTPIDDEADEADEGPETPPDYTSSVQTTPEDEVADEAETDESEAAQDAALAALATVTPDEASAAALASQPGTVEEVELDNEAGNVVYEVEIVDDAGAEFEVIIDAGNGAVLASAAD